MTFLRIVIPLCLLFEPDLFGKPLHTFPDHALDAAIVLTSKRNRQVGSCRAPRFRARAQRLNSSFAGDHHEPLHRLVVLVAWRRLLEMRNSEPSGENLAAHMF